MSTNNISYQCLSDEGDDINGLVDSLLCTIVWKQQSYRTLSDKSSECPETELYTKYMGNRTRVVKIGHIT